MTLSRPLAAAIKCLYDGAADRNISGHAVLHGDAKQMSTYKFVMVTHILADANGLVAILSKLMQKETPTYPQMRQAVVSTMVALKSLLVHDGPYTTLGRQQFPDEPPVCGITDFCGREIKDTASESTASERAKFVAAARTSSRVLSIS